MTKTLSPPSGRPQILTATTTAKLARRMLCSSRTVAEHLPLGLHGSPALDILLALHVAEEDAQYLRAGDLAPSGSLSDLNTQRWVRVLEEQGFVDRQGDMLALSSQGHELISGLLEAIYLDQRALD